MSKYDVLYKNWTDAGKALREHVRQAEETVDAWHGLTDSQRDVLAIVSVDKIPGDKAPLRSRVILATCRHADARQDHSGLVAVVAGHNRLQLEDGSVILASSHDVRVLP